jgi:UDP-N-acetylmuramoylalanine--D-glutamate ligase
MSAGPHTLVLGLGASGEAAARLLLGEGCRVVVADRNDTPALRGRASGLEKAGAQVVLGWAGSDAMDAALCVVSPGVPIDSAPVRALRKRGIPVVSELELAATRCRCPIVSVTGSNGKSTMVKLCGDVLRRGGARVELAGNYGPPLSGVVARSHALDWVVVEASSFQLEGVDTFRPRVGVLMNLNPNHLDRHRTLAAYRRAKMRQFTRMRSGDSAVVHESQFAAFRRGLPDAAGASWVRFGEGARATFRFDDGAVICGASASGDRFSVRGTYFDNPVLGQTAAAAAAVASACGFAPGLVAQAAESFVPLPHRTRQVAEVRGVRFIDDSKATTLAAMAAGIRMTGGPIRLIAGGRLKEHRLDGVKKVLVSHVRAIYLIGESRSAMARAWGEVLACRDCGTLREAVLQAWGDSQPGEAILLSPGCASFDQFRSFEERGDQFGAIAAAIAEGSGS